MRTERSDGVASWLARLGTASASGQRWWRSLTASSRAGLVVLLVVVALVAVLGMPLRKAEPQSAVLFGRDLPASQAQEMTRVLTASGIEAVTVGGQVRVLRKDLAQAEAALQKAGAMPRSLRNLADSFPEGGLLLSSLEREQRQTRRREQMVEEAIRKIDPSLEPVVRIHREEPKGLTRSGEVQATVWLEVQRPGRIPAQTIERICWAVHAWVPELDEDGVMLLDSTGRPYLLAGDDTLGERSALRAREEELRDAILERLDWINGVRVAVSLKALQNSGETDPVPEASLNPEGGESHEPDGEAAVDGTQRAAPSAPVVAVNRPLGEDDGSDASSTEQESPQEESKASAETVAAQVPADAPSTSEELVALKPDESSVKATVLVRVPNTFYSQLGEQIVAATNRSPTLDDLQVLVRQTEASIESSVSSVIPRQELETIRIERIYIPGTAQVATLGTRGEGGLSSRWTTASVSLIAAGAILTLAALFLGQFRRPSTGSAQANRGRHESQRRPNRPVISGRTNSERVREIVRMDPGAAAGVLQRWIAAGGGER